MKTNLTNLLALSLCFVAAQAAAGDLRESDAKPTESVAAESEIVDCYMDQHAAATEPCRENTPENSDAFVAGGEAVDCFYEENRYRKECR